MRTVRSCPDPLRRILLLLLASALLALPGLATEPGAEGTGRRWNPIKLSAAQQQKLGTLSLTAEQKSELAALPEKQRAWRKANEAKLHEIAAGMREARKAGDEATRKRLRAERNQLFSSRPGYGDILTESQAEELKKLAPRKRPAQN